MSIEFIRDGDLFESGCEALVNPVNCVGVSGAGLALEFKKRFPENQQQYQKWCAVSNPKPGMLLECSDGGKLILNVATKNHWRNPSRLAWIIDVVTGIREVLTEVDEIKSIAIPALGCGHGGLDWERVRPIMEEGLIGLDCLVKIYEPK